MSHLHSDAQPPLNFLGALLAGIFGVIWSMGPLLDGAVTAEELLYVAGGAALTLGAVTVSFRWGEDSLLTLPAVAIPGIMLLPQFPLTPKEAPLAAALVIPAVMLVVMSIPLLLGWVIDRMRKTPR
jgi:hypothetical protein